MFTNLNYWRNVLYAAQVQWVSNGILQINWHAQPFVVEVETHISADGGLLVGSLFARIIVIAISTNNPQHIDCPPFVRLLLLPVNRRGVSSSRLHWVLTSSHNPNRWNSLSAVSYLIDYVCSSTSCSLSSLSPPFIGSRRALAAGPRQLLRHRPQW